MSAALPGGLFIVSAPSGGGKTSLTRALVPWLAARGVPAVISVSTTTRAPRPGEWEGVHYHYVDEARFERLVAEGAFLEHASVFGRRYGTRRADVLAQIQAGRDVILDIDWQGARQVRAAWPEAHSIFILPPSVAELERRLRGRGQDTDAVIAARMAAARTEMAHHDEYGHLIVNESFELALEQLGAVFLEARLRGAAQRRRHAGLIAALLAVPGAAG
jgi:guanylate kinase